MISSVLYVCTNDNLKQMFVFSDVKKTKLRKHCTNNFLQNYSQSNVLDKVEFYNHDFLLCKYTDFPLLLLLFGSIKLVSKEKGCKSFTGRT